MDTLEVQRLALKEMPFLDHLKNTFKNGLGLQGI